MKYSGKIIRATPPSTTTGYGANGTAGGMWTATEALQKKAVGAWPKAPQAPGAPTITNVTAGNAQATITFTAPEDTGGLSITEYTVTSSPGDITASGSTSPITVTGLTNGTSYTFTVRASNNKGLGIASSASSSVIPTNAVSVTYLVVAGGGGGGYYYGGGGGGGGYRTGSLSVSPGVAHTVTVGAGGLGWHSSPQTVATNGSNSVFASITSAGGGYGAQDPSTPANSGGSGGGGNGNTLTSKGLGNTPSTSPSQGNDGADGVLNQRGGGGGGAGSAGSNQNGGNGSTAFDGNTYAGGGAAWTSSGSGTAGSGGGGIAGSSGTVNSGGGGGGWISTPGNGGSGIVIVRYPDSIPAATATTGSPEVTTSGGYRYYKFTGSGTITL